MFLSARRISCETSEKLIHIRAKVFSLARIHKHDVENPIPLHGLGLSLLGPLARIFVYKQLE